MDQQIEILDDVTIAPEDMFGEIAISDSDTCMQCPQFDKIYFECKVGVENCPKFQAKFQTGLQDFNG